MKKGVGYMLLWGVLLLGEGCKKTSPDVPNGTGINNVFTQNINNIQRGEPVLLSFDSGNDTAVVHWQVSPNSNYTISTAGVYATVYWQQAGNYTVTAQVGQQQATYLVTVVGGLYTEVDTAFGLTASKQLNVLPKEAIAFTVQNATNNSFIWRTSSNISLANTAGSPAYFSFGSGNAGTIRVIEGNKIASRTVWLSDTTLAGVGKVNVPFIFSDKLIITPSVAIGANNQKILVLEAKTQYKYQSEKDTILHLADNYQGSYTLHYGGVMMAEIPQANTRPATCKDSFANLPVGTHLLAINIGNKTIMGSVSLSAAGVYTFGLATNNLVTIYPQTVQ